MDHDFCPRCGSYKWTFSAGWWECRICGELEPSQEETVFADNPRLTPDDYPGDDDVA